MEAVFSQIDYFFSDKLKVVLAGRLDFSTLYDTQFSPKASLVYSFNPGHSLRLTINQAFQTPNYSEFFLKLPVAPTADLSAIENGLSSALDGMDLGLGFESVPVLALGNENLRVEEITSLEIGYSNIFASKIIFHLNYFRSQLKGFTHPTRLWLDGYDISERPPPGEPPSAGGPRPSARPRDISIRPQRQRWWHVRVTTSP